MTTFPVRRSSNQLLSPEAPGRPGAFIEADAGQVVQKAPLNALQIPLIAVGLKASIGSALRRFFLDQFYGQRPVVILQTEVKEGTLQNSPLTPGYP